MDLTPIPLLDHHCHTLRRLPEPVPLNTFRAFFAESTDPAMPPHTAQSVFYLKMLRDLAAHFSCPPTEAAVLAHRAQTDFESYVRQLFAPANFSALLVDTGFPQGEIYDLPALQKLTGIPTHEVLRLESLMEALILQHTTLAEVEGAFRSRLRSAREQGVVAFKSIAAYRGGLEVLPRTFDEANAVFAQLKPLADEQGSVRLAARPLLDYLLRVALEAAACLEIPVQFHIAFGDEDADLRTANPLNLRPLLIDPAFKKVPFVLLHCYPYVREAAYLSSIYSHVFVDLSLTVPLTAHGSIAAFSEALELAPLTKILFATDAHCTPELFYIAALHGRRALARVLEQLVRDDYLTAAQAETAAVNILHTNASLLYGIH